MRTKILTLSGQEMNVLRAIHDRKAKKVKDISAEMLSTFLATKLVIQEEGTSTVSLTSFGEGVVTRFRKVESESYQLEYTAPMQ